ncbi:MAG TPA: A/G-specific adenine glycosylase [Anaerolineales bacterium]|nr:A/G-specific adenine glycosylase [Anaerolineales bacterium]
MATRTATTLLDWYGKNQRDLPWRRTQDPYPIWVAEIMLQQTRVETAVPYYTAWLARFPTIEALAKATEDQVLRQWEGLGYYRRALNLRKAARIVKTEHGGRLPENADELAHLPGIGRYTAAAIAAFAFGRDEIALDGNLRRVLARLIDLDLEVRSPEGEAQLMAFARRHLPRGRASDFNQALMDLGAMVCLPRLPRCTACPVRRTCRARQRGVQEQRPVRRRRGPPPGRIATAGVLRRGGRVLIGRRPEASLLGGLWEFPGGKCRSREMSRTCLRRELREELGIEVEVGESLGVFRHAYTHFRVEVHAFECRLRRGTPRLTAHTALRWVYPSQLGRYPMGQVARRIARRIAGQERTASRLRPKDHHEFAAHRSR